MKNFYFFCISPFEEKFSSSPKIIEFINNNRKWANLKNEKEKNKQKKKENIEKNLEDKKNERMNDNSGSDSEDSIEDGPETCMDDIVHRN